MEEIKVGARYCFKRRDTNTIGAYAVLYVDDVHVVYFNTQGDVFVRTVKDFERKVEEDKALKSPKPFQAKVLIEVGARLSGRWIKATPSVEHGKKHKRAYLQARMKKDGVWMPCFVIKDEHSPVWEVDCFDGGRCG